MRVLVTGADGFVGGWLTRALVGEGHDVVGTYRDAVPEDGRSDHVTWQRLDLADRGSVRALTALTPAPDAVIHLAAVASVGESAGDPELAWEVNALGTARLLEALDALREEAGADPRVLVVSTAEVYGPGDGSGSPRRETDPVEPVSVYAATKAAGEMAALEAHRRAGLRVLVARPFPHTGPGQSDRFVTSAFIRRLREAARNDVREVPTGNLDPVRELIDVRDVVAAYLLLVQRGVPGQVYNIASGRGHSLAALFAELARRLHPAAVPAPDPALVRPVDIPHLVGNASRLVEATGWTPRYTLSDTLQDVIDAQAD